MEKEIAESEMAVVVRTTTAEKIELFYVEKKLHIHVSCLVKFLWFFCQSLDAVHDKFRNHIFAEQAVGILLNNLIHIW